MTHADAARETLAQDAQLRPDRPIDDPLPGPPGGGGGGGNDIDPIVLTGAIGAYHAKLGGSSWGIPMEYPQDLGDGGRYVSFKRTPKGSYVKSIVWSARTGARWMTRDVFASWVNHPQRGQLGYPTSEPITIDSGPGRFQNLERGQYVWHPSTGVGLVRGDILAKYTQLGGSAFGYPTTNDTVTPDGRGRFNHFRDVATGAEKSIYWSPETGAHEVFGLIRQAWAARGWERGPLGYPTTGEMPTHDAVGRWQVFANGTSVWHPNTGAHEVQGAIRERYNALGGSGFGYPTTDEGDAARGGRFNHFVHMDSGEQRSIYWSGSTGAVEVYGDIHAAWQRLGWESSSLGYPVAPEEDWPQGGSGSRQQRFEHGRMLWRASDRAVAPDPMVFSQTINATGVRGEVIVTIPYDGRPHFGGYVRAVKIDSYDFIVNAMVSTPSRLAVVFVEKGEINGDLEPGPERVNFDQTSPNAIPGPVFWQFQNAGLAVHKTYDSHLTGTLGDLLEGAVRWVAGATAIATPGVALVLLGGTAAVTALAGGSLASGARIVGGTLMLAGPWGTVIAIAAEAVARLATKERPLTTTEYELAGRVFGASLPARTDILVSDAIGGGARPFSYPRADGKMVISVGEKYYHDVLNYDVPEGKRAYGQLLIHELVHVWQYHHNAAAISYLAEAIWARIRDDYEPGTVLDEPWDWFGLEEQGRIVDAWFRAYYNGPGSRDLAGAPRTPTPATNFGLDSPSAIADQAYRFIRDNIRAGRT